MIPVDTKNILFICGGAFVGIEKKIAQRLNTQVIGYGASKNRGRIDKDNLLQYVAPQDLRAFGMIPEIVGRLPIVAHLDPLDKETLYAILTEPKNALVKQYTKLFKMDNIDLVFADGVLDFIVDKAVEFKLGARGLRSICETIMLDAMFETPSVEKDELVITIDYASNKLKRIDMKVLNKAS
jgi:ATP-dependent Clp protease ATP-binding subunit ClpX